MCETRTRGWNKMSPCSSTSSKCSACSVEFEEEDCPTLLKKEDGTRRTNCPKDANLKLANDRSDRSSRKKTTYAMSWSLWRIPILGSSLHTLLFPPNGSVWSPCLRQQGDMWWHNRIWTLGHVTWTLYGILSFAYSIMLNEISNQDNLRMLCFPEAVRRT